MRKVSPFFALMEKDQFCRFPSFSRLPNQILKIFYFPIKKKTIFKIFVQINVFRVYLSEWNVFKQGANYDSAPTVPFLDIYFYTLWKHVAKVYNLI